MSSFSLQAAWCVGCCLLSKSFWDICSCSACSDFAGTKIITQRTEKKKRSMYAYICTCVFRKEKKKLKYTTGLYYGLKQYHKGDSFVLAAQWRSWIRKVPQERLCRFWKLHQDHSSALEFCYTLLHILACNGKEISILPVCKGVVYGWRADQIQLMHIGDIILNTSSIWSSAFWD